MAKIDNKERTEVLRVDGLFKKFVKELSFEKTGKLKRSIPPSRITKAMLNQYLKYPELKKEIEKSNLK